MSRDFSGWFCVVILLGCSLALQAQGDTVLLRDLSHRWQYLLPDGSVASSPRSANALLIQERLKDKEQLVLIATSPTDIWINGQLHASAFLGKTVLDTLLLGTTPFTMVLRGDSRMDRVVSAKMVSVGVATTVDPLAMQIRAHDASAQVLALSLIILIAGVYKFFFQFSFTGLFARFFYSSRISAEEDAASFGGLRTMLGLLVLAVVLAFVTAKVAPDHARWLASEGSFMWRWLSDTLFILGLMLLRHLAAILLAPLHGLSDLPNIQVKDFIEVFGLGVLLVFVIALTDFFSFQQIAALGLARTALVILWVFYPLWSLWRLRKVTGNRKLVIISYLCTTEFLPGFLAVFWLIKG